MYTRIVKTKVKAGRVQELRNVLNDQVLPLLKKQAGFVDMLTLSATHDPQELLSLSMWKNREDAERYQRDQYEKVQQMVSSLIEGQPEIQGCNVEFSTAYRIATGKAA
ncbi:MAG: antibiotic biosynthesis monooxygenase [Candidatus Korobacteraceae bacterium]